MHRFLPYTICSAQRREDAIIVRIEHAQPSFFYECSDAAGGIHVFHHSDLKPMNTIPSRHREHLFSQVAAHLGAALDAYPNAILLDPKPLAVDTFRRRLMEARQAKKLYAWKHALINEELWAKHHEELTCAITPEGKVALGPLPAIREKRYGAAVAAVPESNDLTLTEPSEIETVCRLLHRKAFRPAPIVLVKGLTADTISSLESRYDIAIVPHETDPTISQIMT